jgi:hypothetical protein
MSSVVSNSDIPNNCHKSNTYDVQLTDYNGPEVLSLKEVKRGRLHMYFHQISRKYGSITKFKLLRRNIYVLNSFDSVEKLLRVNEHANGRSSPFFQNYVLLNKGFSFSDFTKIGEKQKGILKSWLHYEIIHSTSIVLDEINSFNSSLLNQNGNLNTDLFIRQFLSNVFSKQVNLYLFWSKNILQEHFGFLCVFVMSFL